MKTVDEQAATIVVKHREMLVGQRTQAINALRGRAAKFGIVAAKGCANVVALICVLTNEAGIPQCARMMFAQMGRHIAELDLKILDLRRPCRYPVRVAGDALAGRGILSGDILIADAATPPALGKVAVVMAGLSCNSSEISPALIASSSSVLRFGHTATRLAPKIWPTMER